MADDAKPTEIEEYEEGCEPLYTIGVVSRLLGCEPSTLRRYENAGLIAPGRTEGNTRLYSDNNLEILRRVHRLIEEEKLNAQGARMVVDLERRISELEDRISELEARLCDQDSRNKA